MELIERLQTWLNRRSPEWKGLGISATKIARGPEGYDPNSAWVDIESPTHLARLTVWTNGDSDFTVSDMRSGEVLLEEYQVIEFDSDLDKIEKIIIRLFERDG